MIACVDLTIIVLVKKVLLISTIDNQQQQDNNWLIKFRRFWRTFSTKYNQFFPIFLRKFSPTTNVIWNARDVDLRLKIDKRFIHYVRKRVKPRVKPYVMFYLLIMTNFLFLRIYPHLTLSKHRFKFNAVFFVGINRETF